MRAFTHLPQRVPLVSTCMHACMTCVHVQDIHDPVACSPDLCQPLLHVLSCMLGSCSLHVALPSALLSVLCALSLNVQQQHLLRDSSCYNCTATCSVRLAHDATWLSPSIAALL